MYKKLLPQEYMYQQLELYKHNKVSFIMQYSYNII